MKKFDFTINEFWKRSGAPIYDLSTDEEIDHKRLTEIKDLEVLYFEPWKDGIGVELESEDKE